MVIAIVGSGMMAATLVPNDVGLQLLQNAAAVAGALIGLIIMFASVSGAHFNPAVTLVDRLMGDITTREAARYDVQHRCQARAYRRQAACKGAHVGGWPPQADARREEGGHRCG